MNIACFFCTAWFRRTRNGGDVCCYVTCRCHVNYQKRVDLMPNQVRQAKSQSFIIASIYRPPNATVDSFSKIERLIQPIDNENKDVYILL